VKGERARATRVFAGLLLCLGVLMARAGWIQVFRAGEFSRRAQRQHFTRVSLPAPRGRILDRHGRILAGSYHSCSVAVDPQVIEDIPSFATRLAFALGDAPAAPHFAARIERRKAAGARFVYLRRWIDRPLAERVKLADLPGVDLREEPRREYPHGAAAAALIGLVVDDRGLCGLEKRFDKDLCGTGGSRAVQRTAGGRLLSLYPERCKKPQAGRDLVTTVDIVIQQVAEEALARMQQRFKPKLSCAIVMDPKTGEILALAGQPAFDPAAKRSGDVLERLRIPAVHNAYPIGSVLKPLIMAWALTRGAVHPDQRLDCGPGHKYFGGRLLHDVKPNGVLDLDMVLVKSSNIGMAQVGMALGIDDAYHLLGLLGFGQKTGIEIAGERSGGLTPRKDWSERYTLISISMGREVMITPLQLVRAYSALLNGGRLVQPTLLAHRRQSTRHVPFSAESLAFVRAAMERVVREGTGRRARVKGVAVAGKTGTSKIEFKGRAPRYVSSFIGYAPAEDPTLLVMVLADDPKKLKGLRPFGGTVAAPVAREIFARGLPLLKRTPTSTTRTGPMFSGSGVRHLKNKQTEGKVRVAAVHWSSVKAGERISPAGRNPDSEDIENCRSTRR